RILGVARKRDRTLAFVEPDPHRFGPSDQPRWLGHRNPQVKCADVPSVSGTIVSVAATVASRATVLKKELGPECLSVTSAQTTFSHFGMRLRECEHCDGGDNQCSHVPDGHLTTQLSGRPRCHCRSGAHHFPCALLRPALFPGPLKRVVRRRSFT